MRQRIAATVEFLVLATSLATTVTALVAGAVMGWSGVTINEKQGNYYVLDIDGPAVAQTELREGDRVVLIDGHSPGNWLMPFWQWQPGYRLSIVVDRDEQLVYVVELESIPDRVFKILPLVVALAFWFSSALNPGFAAQNESTRLFRITTLICSIALSLGYLSLRGITWVIEPYKLFLYLSAPVSIHFHLSLPDIRLERQRRPILALVYAICFFSIMVDFNRFVLLALAVLVFWTWLLYGYKTSRNLNAKRRVRIILVGTFLAWGPFLVLSMLPRLIIDYRAFPFQLSMLFLILIPVVYWYAALRHDLWRMDLIFNQALVKCLVILGLVATFVITLRVSNISLQLNSQTLGNALILAVVGVAYYIPANWVIQRIIGRLLYGGYYDYRSVVSRISAQLPGVKSRDELERALRDAVESLWVRGAAFLLLDSRETTRLTGSRHGEFVIDGRLLCLFAERSLGQTLRGHNFPIDSVALRRRVDLDSLSEAETLLLQNDTIRWWVPVVSDQRLIGVLLLSSRRGDERFDETDCQILATLSNNAALALNNVLLLEELQEKLVDLERAHRRLLWSREEERKRLARDLHDGPIQSLSVFETQVNEHVRRNPDLQPVLQPYRDQTRAILAQLRAACYELRPPLDLGLFATIMTQCERSSVEYNLEIQLSPRDESAWQFSEGVAVVLYRIFQEALTNIIRHASASHVDICLSTTETEIALEIRDDGVGFDASSDLNRFAASGHYGLVGISELVELLHGQFDVYSSVDDGTTLHIRLQRSIE